MFRRHQKQQAVFVEIWLRSALANPQVSEHKEDHPGTFTAKYHLHKPVYVEAFASIMNAIDRETQLKGRSRKKKMDLIRTTNPDFNDLQESYV